jgi:hypothetical protein
MTAHQQLWQVSKQHHAAHSSACSLIAALQLLLRQYYEPCWLMLLLPARLAGPKHLPHLLYAIGQLLLVLAAESN